MKNKSLLLGSWNTVSFNELYSAQSGMSAVSVLLINFLTNLQAILIGRRCAMITPTSFEKISSSLKAFCHA